MLAQNEASPHAVGVATLTYYTDATRSDMKGQHTLASSSQVFSIAAEGLHKHCFKLLANGSDIIMDADTPNIRIKWIMAIESMVLDIRQHQQTAANCGKLHNEGVQPSTIPDPLAPSNPVAITAGVPPPPVKPLKRSLLKTGSDVSEYVGKFNPLKSSTSSSLSTASPAESARLAVMQELRAHGNADGGTTQSPTATATTEPGSQPQPPLSTLFPSVPPPLKPVKRIGQVSIEQQVLRSAESLLQCWILTKEGGNTSDKINTSGEEEEDPSFQEFKKFVSEPQLQVTATIVNSEFTLSASGAENVWELIQGNVFFNPLGNFVVSSTIPIIPAPSSAEGETEILSVWCELFVLPANNGKNNWKSSSRQQQQQQISSPTSSVSLSNSNNITSVTSVNLSSPTTISGSGGALHPMPLEEYEVQIIFAPLTSPNDTDPKVSRLVFNRIDTGMVGDESMLLGQPDESNRNGVTRNGRDDDLSDEDENAVCGGEDAIFDLDVENDGMNQRPEASKELKGRPCGALISMLNKQRRREMSKWRRAVREYGNC